MIFSKKGFLQSEIIRILIIAIIVVLTFYFGYRGISRISETSCKSGLALLEKDLQTAVNAMASQTGSVEEKEYKVPCDIGRMYFFDLKAFASLGLELPFEPFLSYPQIKDSIEAKVEHNVFLVKDNKITNAFYIGDIKIGPPYYDCYITKYGNLDLYLEGKKGKTGILKKDAKFDCTFTEGLPVVLSDEDEEKLLGEVGEEEVIEEGCEIIRKIVEIPGEEGVRVVINKTGTSECRYFENIPKCAVKSLIKAIEKGDFPLEGDWEIFAEDPIIMWDFSAGDDGGFYEILNNLIEEACKREFKGAPFKKGAKTEIDPGVLSIRDDMLRLLGGVIGDYIDEEGGRETGFDYLSQIVKHWSNPNKVKKVLGNLEELFEKYDVDEDYYGDYLACLEGLVEGKTTCEVGGQN